MQKISLSITDIERFTSSTSPSLNFDVINEPSMKRMHAFSIDIGENSM